MAILQARPTLRDIGVKTGFHYSTVSLALRDHPRISDSTKQIIREAAEGLGYQPDAMLSSLCAYRLTKRPPKEQTVIAWITNHRTQTGWGMSACTRDYFDGASQRATERGYRVETFWLAEPGMTGQRMSRILWTRGVQGVLLPPQEHLTSRIDLHGIICPPVHLDTLSSTRVCIWSQTMNTEPWARSLPNWKRDPTDESAWSICVNMTNESITIGWPPISSSRLACRWNINCRRWSSSSGIPGHSCHGLRVIDRTRLSPGFRRSFAVSGVPATVYRTTSVSLTTRWMKKVSLSGMKKNSFQIGEMAVDLVIDMLHRNERGIPIYPYLLMVEGSWVEGNTLRPASSSSPAASTFVSV